MYICVYIYIWFTLFIFILYLYIYIKLWATPIYSPVNGSGGGIGNTAGSQWADDLWSLSRSCGAIGFYRDAAAARKWARRLTADGPGLSVHSEPGSQQPAPHLTRTVWTHRGCSPEPGDILLHIVVAETRLEGRRATRRLPSWFHPAKKKKRSSCETQQFLHGVPSTVKNSVISGDK